MAAMSMCMLLQVLRCAMMRTLGMLGNSLDKLLLQAFQTLQLPFGIAHFNVQAARPSRISLFSHDAPHSLALLLHHAIELSTLLVVLFAAGLPLA